MDALQHLSLIRILKNGGKGHCWAEVVTQALAIVEGWPVDLVERVFSTGDSEQLARLRVALRRLTIAAFEKSTDPMITDDFEGEQTATTPEEIQRLALDNNARIVNRIDFKHVVSFTDTVLGGGGHGDERAILSLCEGFGLELSLGRKEDVPASYIEVPSGSPITCMAFHNGGHWALTVLNVS